MYDLPIVNTISSGRPGPTIAIIAGVHGDEPVGVFALNEILSEISLLKGKLVGIIANPPALQKGVRFLNQNLNRSLVPDLSPDTNEGRLARVLMRILDSADACLDLHAGMGGEPPFVICEKSGFEIAGRMPVSIVSTGWVEAEPGSTDEYMYRRGKPALCLECGDKRQPLETKPIAVEAIKQFLGYFGMIECRAVAKRPQNIFAVRYPVFRRTKTFAFTRRFRGFEKLVQGELIATDGEQRHIAPGYPASIVFPWEEAPIGTEAFLISELVGVTNLS